jgi:hypothetical protein
VIFEFSKLRDRQLLDLIPMRENVAEKSMLLTSRATSQLVVIMNSAVGHEVVMV